MRMFIIYILGCITVMTGFKQCTEVIKSRISRDSVVHCRLLGELYTHSSEFHLNDALSIEERWRKIPESEQRVIWTCNCRPQDNFGSSSCRIKPDLISMARREAVIELHEMINDPIKYIRQASTDQQFMIYN